MILTQLFIMGTGFVDTVMAGRYSPVTSLAYPRRQRALAEFHAAHRHYYGAVAYYVTTARRWPYPRNRKQIRRQGLWLCLVSSTLLVSVLLNAEIFFGLVDIDPKVAHIASEYLLAVSWGIPPIILYVALRHTSEGLA